MRYYGNRQLRMAQRLGLRAAQPLKCGGTHGQRGEPGFCGFNTVVDTPRRARASVAGAGDNGVALLDKLFKHFGLDWHLPRLAVFFYRLDAIARLELRFKVFHQKLEIGFGVIDKTNDLALQVFQCAPYGYRVAISSGGWVIDA